MSTLSVVNYSDKLNVLQQTTGSDNSKQLQRQIIILRKPPEVINSNILLTNTSKRKAKPKELTRVHNPPPVAVARRNARERNRVKQVNNGFATLRQHIPTAIAAAYDSGNGRGNNKKLSKVETLRMAVEYIKSLEKLLSLSSSDDSTGETSSYSFQEDENEFHIKQNSPRKGNFNLLYEDEENIHPSAMEDMDEDLINNATLGLSEPHDIALLSSIDNSASLSPEVYSENSLSPVHIETKDNSFIPVFNTTNQTSLLPSFTQLNYRKLPQIKSELLSPNETQIPVEGDLSATSEQQILYISSPDGTLTQHDIEVLWWQQQQLRS